MKQLLTRIGRALFADDTQRILALQQQAKAASDYARHVVMMRRCVDELFRESRALHEAVQSIRELVRSGCTDLGNQLDAACESLRGSLGELKRQKAELAAMEATQARQEERFAQNKFALLSDGAAVEDITLVPPDLDAADYEADSLIASFELDTELAGEVRPGLH